MTGRGTGSGTAAPPPRPIAPALLAWYDRHGRYDLPWKERPTPYRIWVSEIMLQQTQVKAVLPFYTRFTDRFPDVGALAEAPLDSVLHLWSGLGYYARARNLHRAARIVRAEHGGELPRDAEALMGLPGIGRSTAGAILALAWGARHPILDGNAKRVLARYHAVAGWPGEGAVSRRLWSLAEHHTPRRRVADYTQAIMDLGATVCARTRPRCLLCPLAGDCAARRSGRETDFPAPKPRRELPERATVFLLVRDEAGRVLLERRPPEGIWGGLWCFPECAHPSEIEGWCADALGRVPVARRALPERQHGFSHYRLRIHPVLLDVESVPGRVMEGDRRVWYNDAEGGPEVGLAAPVAALLGELEHEG